MNFKYKSYYTVPTGFNYLGHEVKIENGAWNDTVRTTKYNAVYYKTPFNVQYSGLVGTQQSTLYKNPTTGLTGDNFAVTSLSFEMRESMVHTFSIGFGLDIVVENTIAGGLTNTHTLSVVWSKVTSKQRSAKIASNVGQNITGAPFVSLSVYKISTDIIVVTFTERATRNWIWESWKPDTYLGANVTTGGSITLGYAAFYAYLGGNNNPNFKTGQYLIDNNSKFPSTQYKSKAGTGL